MSFLASIISRVVGIAGLVAISFHKSFVTVSVMITLTDNPYPVQCYLRLSALMNNSDIYFSAPTRYETVDSGQSFLNDLTYNQLFR